MNAYHDIAARYLDAWNEADDTSRHDLIAATWAEDAHYVDPLMSGERHDGLTAMIAAARTHFPGHRFSLVGAPDGHGNHLRFSWSLAAEGGAVVGRGTDFATLDTHGRLVSVTGFLDQDPVAV
jgi:SnoaL-like domain